jgi:hypothetical protein
VGVVGATEENLLEPSALFSFMSFMEPDPSGDPEARMMMAPEETDDTNPSDSLPATPAQWLKRAEQGMNPNELALFQAVAAAAGLSIAQAQFESGAHAGEEDGPATTEQAQGDAHTPFHALSDGLAHYGLPSNLEALNSDLPKPVLFDQAKPHGFEGFDGNQLHLRNKSDDTDAAEHRETAKTYRADDDDSSRTLHHESKHAQQHAEDGNKSGADEDGAQVAKTSAEGGDVLCNDIDLSGLANLVDMSGLSALGAFGKVSSHHASMHEAALPRLENVIDFTRDLFSDPPFAHSGGQASGAKPDGFAAQGHHPHAETIAPIDIMHQIAADMEAVAQHMG